MRFHLLGLWELTRQTPDAYDHAHAQFYSTPTQNVSQSEMFHKKPGEEEEILFC